MAGYDDLKQTQVAHTGQLKNIERIASVTGSLAAAYGAFREEVVTAGDSDPRRIGDVAKFVHGVFLELHSQVSVRFLEEKITTSEAEKRLDEMLRDATLRIAVDSATHRPIEPPAVHTRSRKHAYSEGYLKRIFRAYSDLTLEQQSKVIAFCATARTAAGQFTWRPHAVKTHPGFPTHKEALDALYVLAIRLEDIRKAMLEYGGHWSPAFREKLAAALNLCLDKYGPDVIRKIEGANGAQASQLEHEFGCGTYALLSHRQRLVYSRGLRSL